MSKAVERNHPILGEIDVGEAKSFQIFGNNVSNGRRVVDNENGDWRERDLTSTCLELDTDLAGGS
jgi:hypothetical protein